MHLYEGRRTVPAHLRHRFPCDMSKSDQELFEELPLGDPWVDGGLHHVWKYLWSSKHVQIPDSCIQSMTAFDTELTQTVSCLHVCILSESAPGPCSISADSLRFVLMNANGLNSIGRLQIRSR